MDQTLKLAVQPPREDRDWSAVGVVGGVDDELIVGGERKIPVDRVGVVGLQSSFSAVVELTVADQKTIAACREKVAVGAGEAVDGCAKSDRIGWAPPIAPPDRQPSRQAAVNIRK